MFLKYVWITIPHLSVCLPTLNLTIFEQQVCSIKMDYANGPSLGGKAEKKESDRFKQRKQSKKTV